MIFIVDSVMMRTEIRLRRTPYPYKAMLAICSDLDETPDWRTYLEIMRFLNTTQTTSIGPGVGLEVGNSIYFDMSPDQFSYWNTDDAGRDMVRNMIRSGHIDCLHSFGDLAVTRRDAARALDELDRHNCRLEVWIDHGTAPTNFGSDIMMGHGDQVGHEAYHADLTVGQGVQFVWRGRVTSVIGQDVPFSSSGLWTRHHPLASVRTLVKESAKHLLGRLGNSKYRMHRNNRVMQSVTLRDGTRVYEFLRSNPHWRSVSAADTGTQISQVLTPRILGRLVDRQGFCILYSHLGKMKKSPAGQFDSAVEGFRCLAEWHHNKKILVTTTRRLLGYCRMQQEIFYDVSSDANGLTLRIEACNMNPCDLNGLSFYVPDPAATRLILNGREVSNVQRNGPDCTGMSSISLPWSFLEFPAT